MIDIKNKSIKEEKKQIIYPENWLINAGINVLLKAIANSKNISIKNCNIFTDNIKLNFIEFKKFIEEELNKPAEDLEFFGYKRLHEYIIKSAKYKLDVKNLDHLEKLYYFYPIFSTIKTHDNSVNFENFLDKKQYIDYEFIFESKKEKEKDDNTSYLDMFVSDVFDDFESFDHNRKIDRVFVSRPLKYISALYPFAMRKVYQHNLDENKYVALYVFVDTKSFISNFMLDDLLENIIDKTGINIGIPPLAFIDYAFRVLYYNNIIYDRITETVFEFVYYDKANNEINKTRKYLIVNEDDYYKLKLSKVNNSIKNIKSIDDLLIFISQYEKEKV